MDISVLFPKFPCRGCLDEQPLSNLHSLNDQETRNLFTECTTVQIDPNDTSYRNICHICYELCGSWNKFRRKALECDIKIRKECTTIYNVEQSENLVDNDSRELKAIVDDLGISFSYQDHQKKICSFCQMEQHSKRDKLVPNCKFCPTKYFHQSCLPLHKISHEKQANCDIPVFESKEKPQKQSANSSRIQEDEIPPIDESLICPYGLEEQTPTEQSETKAVSVPRSRTYKCEECSKYFTGKRVFMLHKQTHSSELSNERLPPISRPPQKGSFFCEICGFEFKFQSSLKLHIQAVHRKERPHKCPLCDKCFSQSGNLTLHLRIHNNEKNYKCELCDRSFISQGYLTVHTRKVHDNEKRFQCDICPEGFFEKHKLEDHRRRRHTGERPFVCEICESSFIDKNGLRKHGAIHMR